ncbi:GNAT family N-acetyltransferase [Actinoplanes sp. RD1]|uniref:GNAT family N-acetyltransferase n=1 Tax=Actinoplanes sp. RD1 TaxID=3064538 RepID=UPI0027411494|nr:GNAT family N-acetyltransferase [Actinoplanes sp. RD1]
MALDALTSDGGIISIRPVQPDDREALARLYGEASPESLRLRFFAAPSSAGLAAEVDRLCAPESDGHVAMLAAEGDELIGLASCGCPDRAGRRAEFAVFVADAHRGRGIGTLLLEHLAARARRHGIEQLIGEVLPGNAAMLRVAHDLSPDAWSRLDAGVVDVGLAVADDETAGPAVDARDRAAERASLRAVLSPTSVAVVGAGHRPGSVGHETLRALREYGFAGRLHAVNRSGATVPGIPACRSVAELPTPVDLLVVAVPAEQVLDVVADGAVAGVAHDPLLGLGGVHTDLLGDRALRLVPMTDLDAGRMWRSLRAAPLLTGYRGSVPVDTAALEDLLLRLGRLAEDLPEVAELDLNPVLAGPDGVVAVDAKLRLTPAGAEPDPMLRALRPADPSREETPS